MAEDTREAESGLSRTFKGLLATAVAMPLVAVIGGTMAFYFSYRVGCFIVLTAVVTGVSSLVACLLLRVSGRHLSKQGRRLPGDSP